MMNMLEADEMAEETAAAEDAEVSILENGRNEVGSKQRLLQADPCMDKHCGAGRVCKVRHRRKQRSKNESHSRKTCQADVQPRFPVYLKLNLESFRVG